MNILRRWLRHLQREDADRGLQDAAVGRLPGHRGILPLRAGRGALGGAETLGDSLSSDGYCAGVMAVQAEQCRRLLPGLAQHELCAGNRSSVP